MPEVLHVVTIHAAPAAVYAALTEQDALRGWWSEHSHARPEVGSTAAISFYGGQVTFKLRVDALEPAERVTWVVEEGPPNWIGTHIVWSLSSAENEDGTDVHLGHYGFACADRMFASVNYNWGWYLTSLKKYLETGLGTPHTDADMVAAS